MKVWCAGSLIYTILLVNGAIELYKLNEGGIKFVMHGAGAEFEEVKASSEIELEVEWNGVWCRSEKFTVVDLKRLAYKYGVASTMLVFMDNALLLMSNIPV